MAEKLKIIPLWAVWTRSAKNMTAYEYGGEIIVVDCGMAFPGRRHVRHRLRHSGRHLPHQEPARIRGLFITHGHEDHIGAIPYVLRQVNMPCTAPASPPGSSS
jgi:ribonuclease J